MREISCSAMALIRGAVGLHRLSSPILRALGHEAAFGGGGTYFDPTHARPKGHGILTDWSRASPDGGETVPDGVDFPLCSLDVDRPIGSLMPISPGEAFHPVGGGDDRYDGWF